MIQHSVFVGHMSMYIILCTQAQTHIKLIFCLWASNLGHEFHPKWGLSHFSITLLNYFPRYGQGDKYLIQVSGNHLFLHLVLKDAVNNSFLHLVCAFIYTDPHIDICMYVYVHLSGWRSFHSYFNWLGQTKFLNRYASTCPNECHQALNTI